MKAPAKDSTRGKNIKNPFSKSETKTKGTLELIHSDVCDPMSSTSLSGFEYYITCIYDYSRKTCIYFLKAKNEVFEKFKEFKALINNIFDKRIKTPDQTMVENILQKILNPFAKMLESRGN